MKKSVNGFPNNEMYDEVINGINSSTIIHLIIQLLFILHYINVLMQWKFYDYVDDVLDTFANVVICYS